MDSKKSMLVAKINLYMKLVEQKQEIENELNEIKEYLINHKKELEDLYNDPEFLDYANKLDLTQVPIVVNQTKGQVAPEVFNDIKDETILLEFAQRVWKPSVPKFRVAMQKHPELQKYYQTKEVTFVKITSLDAIRKKLEKAQIEGQKDIVDELIEEL